MRQSEGAPRHVESGRHRGNGSGIRRRGGRAQRDSTSANLSRAHGPIRSSLSESRAGTSRRTTGSSPSTATIQSPHTLPAFQRCAISQSSASSNLAARARLGWSHSSPTPISE